MASGIRCNLSRGAHRIALTCVNRSLAYGQLVDRIDRVASLGLSLFFGATVMATRKDGVAGYKVPRQVVFVDALPRNPAGKVLDTELRKLD